MGRASLARQAGGPVAICTGEAGGRGEEILPGVAEAGAVATVGDVGNAGTVVSGVPAAEVQGAAWRGEPSRGGDVGASRMAVLVDVLEIRTSSRERRVDPAAAAIAAHVDGTDVQLHRIAWCYLICVGCGHGCRREAATVVAEGPADLSMGTGTDQETPKEYPQIADSSHRG